ncbi:MAG: winged helix-turn-helix domain-containing protein, partial [Terriglobia bacterium]
MTRQPQSIHEFGPYRIDAAKRLLLRDGEVVPLTPKCFEILLVLVENSGEVVDKESLMNRVWPDSFVEEGNLTYNISVLRKALGERANEHLYIVTVPGRGYQFVAGVSEVRL